MPSARQITVGFPLYDGTTLLDFAGASQVFPFARTDTLSFRCIWLAAAKCPVETTEGVSVVPTATFDYHPPLDVVFVPGGGAQGVVWAMSDPAYQGFLRRVAAEPTRPWMGSVCTGAFPLAAARLLDGCEVTTYWSQIPNLGLLAKKMNLRVAPDYPRYLVDEARRRFTGGGISSSIDLALELVKHFAGQQAAEAAQLSVQYAPHPPTNTGDPSVAPPALTAAQRVAQQAGFIDPIRVAVEALIS